MCLGRSSINDFHNLPRLPCHPPSTVVTVFPPFVPILDTESPPTPSSSLAEGEKQQMMPLLVVEGAADELEGPTGLGISVRMLLSSVKKS